jgi:predicted component of type VI protein secretion system
MKVKLVIVSPEVKPNEYDITLPTKIGRGHEAKLKLVHPLVSRLHCELFNQGEQVYIRDLDSLNGTFVDQQRIDEDTPLGSGATVMMGTVMFQVRYGPDRDRLPPPVKMLEKTASADGTIRSETVDRAAKPAAGRSDKELGDHTVEEPTAVVSEEEAESLAFLDEEPGERRPRQRSPGQAAKPAGNEAASLRKTPAAKPTDPAGNEDDEPFTVEPIDESAKEEAPPGEKDDMDDFLNSIM